MKRKTAATPPIQMITKGIALLLCSALLLTSCYTMRQQGQHPEGTDGNPSHQPWNMAMTDVQIPITAHNGQSYVPLAELLQAMGFRMEVSEDNKDEIQIGDIDAISKITLQSSEAEVAEQTVTLSAAPTTIDGQVYIPVETINVLLDQDMNYQVANHHLVLHSTQQDPMTMDDLESDVQGPDSSEGPFFQDDPDDPFRGGDDGAEDEPVWHPTPTVSSTGPDELMALDEPALPVALKNIDINALIREARRYRGVPYLFGASPYPKSKKFDCSSFTQYVYGKFGVKLSRVARNQAKQGQSVSRTKLRKGDLVFFSVPGRFKSNKIVGHVGIYIGNGQMINTFSNKKGVHIASINKGYWSTKYLGARRVAY